MTKTMIMFLIFGRKFEMIMMKDYHNLYLKWDVLLPAGVFEKIRNNSLKTHGLCPSHYLGAPGLNWDEMLKMTKVKLEFIADPDMHIIFEKGTRGGISYISNRKSKANIKYLKSYDPKQESKHIIYLDANNLHGYAMSKFLPTNGFSWIDPKEFALNKYTSNNSKGHVLEVDFKYSKELSKLHNDYPLAPDKIEIKREMLSEYELKITDLCNILIGNVKKLVPNLFGKENYMLHYENLKLYLKLWLKLKKVHRVLQFSQSQWLKRYEFKTRKRIEAETNNDKDGKGLCKLRNNAIYGKTMENLKNRINVKLVNNEKDFLKCTWKLSYMSHKIFDNNLVAIRKSKLALKLSKPAYTGIFILGLGKVLMYEFYYDYINNKYDNKSKL